MCYNTTMIGRKRRQRGGLFTSLPEAPEILKAIEALEPDATLEVNFADARAKQGFYTFLCGHYRGQYQVRNPSLTSILVTKRRFKRNTIYGDRRRRDIVRILETLAGKGLIHFAGVCPNRAASLVEVPISSPKAQKVNIKQNLHNQAEAVALEIPSRKLVKSEDLSPPPTEPANFGSQT